MGWLHARPVSRVLSRLGPLYPCRGRVVRSSDGHSSRSTVARALQQPTRGFDTSPTAERLVGEVGHLSPPIWPCSDRGLPSHACCQACGGLLPHLFTLTSGLRRRRFVFCGTVRHDGPKTLVPRRYLAICPLEPGLSSKGARRHRSRPSGRPCNRLKSTRSAGLIQVNGGQGQRNTNTRQTPAPTRRRGRHPRRLAVLFVALF